MSVGSMRIQHESVIRLSSTGFIHILMSKSPILCIIRHDAALFMRL